MGIIFGIPKGGHRDISSPKLLTLLVILILQLTQPVYGVEDQLNITANSVTFFFVYTFSFDSPLYYVDRSYGDLMAGGSNSIFRFNETYKNATFEDLKELNNSGFIELLEGYGDIQFKYTSEPQYRISIHPGYLWVYLKVIDTNLTQEELLEIYKNMESFVYDNVSGDLGCFKNPPDAPSADYSHRFCPLNKHSYSKYQREGWTFLINVEEFSPHITDANYRFFEVFHPLSPYLSDDIKLEKRLQENYLFYYNNPRSRDTILLNFKPKDSWSKLIHYMQLTEIVFAKAENQKADLQRNIKNDRAEIESLKKRVYNTRNITELKPIQKNISEIQIANSSIPVVISELEALDRLEKEILQGTNDIYQPVYYTKIKNHNDLLSNDVEKLSLSFVDLQRERDEALAFAESKIRDLEQLQISKDNLEETKKTANQSLWIAIASILIAIVSFIISTGIAIRAIHLEKRALETLLDKMGESTQKLIKSLERICRKLSGEKER